MHFSPRFKQLPDFAQYGRLLNDALHLKLEDDEDDDDDDEDDDDDDDEDDEDDDDLFYKSPFISHVQKIISKLLSTLCCPTTILISS